jgi:(2Fe-2S) ferredoxin
LINGFRHAAERAGIEEQVQVTNMGSVYLCDLGPVVLVYPDDVWYTHLNPADCDEIVREHLAAGRPVERLRLLPTDAAELARQAIYRELFAAGSMDTASFERLAIRHGFEAPWLDEQLKRKFLNRSADGARVTPTAKMKERYDVK